MNVVIAYCPDVAALRQNIEELEEQGKYRQHITRALGFRVEAVTVGSRAITTGARSKTPVKTSQVENESICQFSVSSIDVMGDPDDPEYVPFLEAAGLLIISSLLSTESIHYAKSSESKSRGSNVTVCVKSVTEYSATLCGYVCATPW